MDQNTRSLLIGQKNPQIRERRCVIPAGMADKEALLGIQLHLNQEGTHGKHTVVLGPSMDAADPLGQRAAVLIPADGELDFVGLLGYTLAPAPHWRKKSILEEVVWDTGEPISAMMHQFIPNPWGLHRTLPDGASETVTVAAVPIRPIEEVDLVQKVGHAVHLPDPDGDHPVWAISVEGRFAGLSRAIDLDKDIRKGRFTNARGLFFPRVHLLRS